MKKGFCMKYKYNWVTVFILTLMVSSQSLAGGDGDGSFQHLPDALIHEVSNYLSQKDWLHFNQGCKTIHHVTQNQAAERQAQWAQKKLLKLGVGDLKWVEPGSFVMGREADEPNPNSNEPRKYVEIKEGYFMAVDDVTEANYDYLMGSGKNHSKKPQRGLTYAEWDIYIARLNQKVAELWPVAYPKTTVLQFKRPSEEQIEYATTIPLDPGHVEEVRDPSRPGKTVKITAKHSRYSGANCKDRIAINFFAVFGKNYLEGPSDVDYVQPNARGFRNLSGNIFKQTDTYYSASSSNRVIRGGSWYLDVRNVRSAARIPTNPAHASPDVGLRLVSVK